MSSSPKKPKAYRLHRDPNETKKMGAPSGAPVTIPAMIDALGDVIGKKRALVADLEKQERELKAKLLTAMKSVNCVTARNDAATWEAVYTKKSGADFSKKALADCYGEDHVKEMEEDLLKAGCLRESEYVQIRAKKPKAKPTVESPLAEDRDVEGEVKEFFGGGA